MKHDECLFLPFPLLCRFHRFGHHRLIRKPFGIVAIIGNGTFISRVDKQRAGNDMVCRTAVAAEHDVLHTGKAGQRLHIRIVRLKGHRVGKKEKIVNLSVHNARTHLLVATQRTGFKDSEIPFHIRMFLPERCEDKGTVVPVQ